MKRRNATRNALFTSIISLLLCVSMLVGTTFAWFTDSVVSGNNVIAAGNLDIELTHTNQNVSGENVEGRTDLFVDENGKKILWEPGVVTYETFTVKNAGSLALKYNMAINFTGENFVVDAEGNQTEYGLSSALKVAVVDTAPANREDAINAGADAGWNSLENFNLPESLLPEETDSYTVVIYWEPSENDNNWNVNNGKSVSDGTDSLSINLGISLTATQLMHEEDSFGKDYDEAATVKFVANDDGSATLTAPVAPALAENETTVEAPAGAFDPTDEVEIKVETENTLFNINSNGAVVAALDVVMTVNGEKTSADLAEGKVYTVTTYISKGLSDVSVSYTGTDGKDQPEFVSYDAETGKLVFTTNHFSEYKVSATAYGYIEAADEAYNLKQVVVMLGEDKPIEVPVADLKEVAAQLTTSDAKNEFKQEYGIAAYGNNYYLTVAEFEKAFEDEAKTLKVLRDFDLTESLTLPAGRVLTLDLNGCTITGTDTTDKSFGLITNKGTLTITGNGKITLTATVNSGWNRYSSVISNNPGGKLIIKNGTIEHLGGTDMAYAIDNLTNGKGTYVETVIEGGTIKSTYSAIRQFLNGVEAENILTIKGGVVESDNRAIFFQDPSKNANTGTLNVTKDATLKGKVHLSVTEGSTEWPVEVSVAAEAVKGEVTYNYLPEGYVVFNNNGTWTVSKTILGEPDENLPADLPVANVVRANEYENADLKWENYGQWSPTAGLDTQLEGAYIFTCTESADEAALSKYADWECDFYVSLNKDLEENQIFLGGNYGSFGWVGFHNGDLKLSANEEIALLGSVTQNPWTYLDVVENVGTFICGVGDVDNALSGATFTVMLRLTNPENSSEFYNVATINYTFK